MRALPCLMVWGFFNTQGVYKILITQDITILKCMYRYRIFHSCNVDMVLGLWSCTSIRAD